MNWPFFSLGFSQASRWSCPSYLEVPSQGLATLSRVSRSLHPWKPLSAPHARGLRPSELSSFPGVEKRSPFSLSAPALNMKTFSAFTSCFSVFGPPEKPCLFLPPEGLVRAETSCSLGLSDLSGSPCVQPMEKASLSLHSLFVLSPENSHEFPFAEP